MGEIVVRQYGSHVHLDVPDDVCLLDVETACKLRDDLDAALDATEEYEYQQHHAGQPR